VCAENQILQYLVMKAAKDRLGCDGADALNRPMERGLPFSFKSIGILLERAFVPALQRASKLSSVG
jgi:hypothetical protein